MSMRYYIGRAVHLSPIAGVVIALVFGLSIAASCEIDIENMQASAPDLTEMSIEDLMSIEVTTAGKRPERISQTPAAVFVITSEDIERYGYQTLTQALRRISGFYSDTDHNYDYLGVRGFLPNGDYNRRILLLINGHRTNDNMYEQAPISQDLPLDMQDIERIEIVKGPGSALWGTDALLAVINCITKDAQDIDGLQVRQDLSWNKGQHFAYGNTLPGGLEISGGLSNFTSVGQREVYSADYDTPAQNSGVAVGLDGERVGRGHLDMSYRGLRLFYSQIARTKDIPTASYDAAFNVPGSDTTDERASWELSYENAEPYAANGKLFCRAYRDTYDYLGNHPWTDPNGTGPTDTILYKNKAFSRSYGAELRYSRDISSRASGIIGVEYLRISDSGKRTWDVEPYKVYVDRQSSASMFSVYAETDWSITGPLRVITGARMDRDSWFGSTWSPRLALIYEKSPKSTLKLLYGKAFRAASPSERRTRADCPGLRPETIRTTELVWERQLGQSGRLVTSLFGFDMYDFITRANDLTVNEGSVDSRGIETQLDYRFKSSVSGYLGLSVARTRSGDPVKYPLLDSAERVATAGVCVPVLGGRAYLSCDAQYTSPRTTYYLNEVGAFATANLALTSSSLIKGAHVSLSISNLFNTPTVAPARNEHKQDVLAQYDRAIQLQLSYTP